MQLLIDGTTTPRQLRALGAMLLSLAAESETHIELTDDVAARPVPQSTIAAVCERASHLADVSHPLQLDPLAVMQAQLDEVPPKPVTIEPPASPKPARAPRKPKAAAEPPVPIPAIPVPPPVQLSIPGVPQLPPEVKVGMGLKEIGDAMGIPMPPQTAPSVPAIPLPPPAITTAAAATSTPQVNGAAPSSPAPTTFPELMQWAMPHIAAKRMDNTTLTAACNAAGLPSLQSLIARQDLVGLVHANLLAAIGGGAA